MNTNTSRKFGLLALAIITMGLLHAAIAEMTNADVVKMVQANISPDIIILSIQNNRASFALDSDSIITLTQNGVSPEIIKAMSAKQTPAPTTRISDRLNLGMHDKIPVFIRNANFASEFVNLNSHNLSAIHDSTQDLLKDFKESSAVRVVWSEKNALVVLEVLDRDTTRSGSLLWGAQNRSTLRLRLTAGSYSTEIKGESGMKGRTTGYRAAASKAVKLVEVWITDNHDRLMALRGEEK
jgi:hypothetical protein